MRICFWNTNKNKNINQYLKSIVIENKVDFLILAEYEDSLEEIQVELNQDGSAFEQLFTSGCDRIKILSKNCSAEPGFQNVYCSIQLVQGNYIFACVHLPSKLYTDEWKKHIAIEEIVEEIHSFEEKLHTDKTIIVGDFNENPYEDGCLGALGFHGMPSHEETMRHYRVVLEKRLAMYYNPMWNLLGDFSFPPGTYYYSGNEVINPLWNMYDQVIISPELKNNFVDEELKIIYKTKDNYLITKNHRPIKDISDHLPLVFEIKEG